MNDNFVSIQLEDQSDERRGNIPDWERRRLVTRNVRVLDSVTDAATTNFPP
jgi:hypothetical protein